MQAVFNDFLALAARTPQNGFAFGDVRENQSEASASATLPSISAGGGSPAGGGQAPPAETNNEYLANQQILSIVPAISSMSVRHSKF
jgi:hypothetical protein